MLIISFFWKHIKPYKWHYAIMLLAPIIGGCYPLAYNYAIKLFLDKMDILEESLTFASVTKPILLFIFTQFVLDLVWRISSIAEWKAEPYVRRSILLYAYDYVQHHPYKFFQDNFTGLISSKLKGILDGYDKFWAEMHHGLLNRIIKATISLIALSMVNVNLFVFIAIWAAIYAPLMYHLSKKLNYLSFKETESRHFLIGSIADRISNIISIFSFAARKQEYLSLDKQITSDFIPKQIQVYKYDFIVQIIAGVLYILMFALIMFYSIYLKKSGLISIGDFAFVFGMTLVVSEDIWHATISLQDFARAMGDFKSAISLLLVPQANLDAPDAKELIIKSPSIVFEKVCFSYDKNKNNKHIFNNLDLSIQAGEKVGLVGHSGAGKSSLINLLLKYFKHSSGRILIDGQDINFVKQDTLRKNIAVIPQDTMLFNRTLFENIKYGNNSATFEEVIEASKKAHIHEFILTLPEQYNTCVGERGIKLSGGQRQRIAIARAILKNAPILILDEATSALDSYTEKLIQEGLNFFIEDKQKTVIAIAHRLSTLRDLDRIIVLEAGRIIDEGKHEELINKENSLYRKLWELQELSQVN